MLFPFNKHKKDYQFLVLIERKMSVFDKEESSLHAWYLQSRHEFIARTALEATKTSSSIIHVLDAGCGIGGISKELRRRGVSVTGCDKNPDAIEQGIKSTRLSDAQIADLCALPYPDNTFDLVICSEVLEHVPDDRQALRELLRVSKGPVFITVPAHRYLWTDSDRLLEHQRRYSRRDLAQLINDSGAQFANIKAFGALPGLMLLGYRLICPLSAQSGNKQVCKPLAIRFRLPRWADRFFYMLSSAELALSRYGLMPWGYAWWTIIQKPVQK